MYEDLASAPNRSIGVKQTVKAVERGAATSVFIACDAEERVVRELRALAAAKAVQVISVESMFELGKVCGIDVGAAAAAILHE